MISDDKYIEIVKRNYSRRKKTGVFILVLAITMTIFMFYGVNTLQEDNNSLVQSLIPKNTGHTYTETDYYLTKSVNALTEAFSTKIGIFIGSTAVTITLMFIESLMLLFGGRKEYLLIKYYEQSKK